MNLGANPKNDYERITKSMFDNQRRDTAPSQRTLLGQELKVLNLRPLNASKHLDDAKFRTNSTKTTTERLQLKYMTQAMNTLQNDEVGLPPLNPNQEKLFRVMKIIKRQNLRDDFTLSQTAKQDLNKSVEGSTHTNIDPDNLDIGDLYAEMIG